MNEPTRSIEAYKSIIKTFVLFLLSATFYMVYIIKFSEFFFINHVAMYLLFAHYLILLVLLVTFGVSIGIRLTRLGIQLYQYKIISLPWPYVFVGYVVCVILTPLLVIYLPAFWILSNKLLSAVQPK